LVADKKRAVLLDIDRDLVPWEKLEKETSKAFAAFISYRRLAPKQRSVQKAVREEYGEGANQGKLRQYMEWSRRFNWVARVLAWDEEVDRKAREEEIQQAKEMRTRHIKMAQALQQKAIEKLRTIKADDLEIEQLLRFIEMGTRLERLSRGEPDAIIEERDFVLGISSATEMSTAELRKVLTDRVKELSDKNFSVEEKQAEPDEYIDGKYRNL
jgi:hypothetical protein